MFAAVVIFIFNIGIAFREMEAYEKGLNGFLAFAFGNLAVGNKIFVTFL
jgi:hypothetical protein